MTNKQEENLSSEEKVYIEDYQNGEIYHSPCDMPCIILTAIALGGLGFWAALCYGLVKLVQIIF